MTMISHQLLINSSQLPNQSCEPPHQSCELSHPCFKLPHQSSELPLQSCKHLHQSFKLPHLSCKLLNLSCKLPHLSCELPCISLQSSNLRCIVLAGLVLTYIVFPVLKHSWWSAPIAISGLVNKYFYVGFAAIWRHLPPTFGNGLSVIVYLNRTKTPLVTTEFTVTSTKDPAVNKEANNETLWKALLANKLFKGSS